MKGASPNAASALATGGTRLEATASTASKGFSAERRIAALCGAAAVLLGIAGVTGWGLGIPFLTRIAPGYKAIAPSVAVALITMGLILPRLAAGHVGRRERVLLRVLVGFLSLLGLFECIGFAVGADLNREDALTAYLARLWSIPFETMSPVAGALLFLVGAAMLALLLGPFAGKGRRGLGDAAGIVGVVAAAVALVFGLGYVYGAPLLYGGPAIPISATGTLGGLLLAVGTVAAAGRDHWPLRALAGDSARARLLRAFVPLAVFAALTDSIVGHRLATPGNPSRVLVGSELAVLFASLTGWVASRVARTLGEAIDRAQSSQQKAEEALRESRDDLNRAQAVAHTGSWRLDVRRNELLWSDENWWMFGVPEGTPLTYETFLATVHPEDRDFVDTSWKAALGGAPYDIEHRILVGDTVKWVRERAVLEFDERGELLGGFGTTQDITEQKQVEQRILAAERARSELLATLNREISHRVKNNLSMVAGMLQMQIASDRDPRLAEMLQDAIARLYAFASVHDQLTVTGSGEADLTAAVRQCAEAAQRVFPQDDVAVSVEGDALQYPSSTAVNLSVAANELITNALKHGAPGSDGQLRIDIRVARGDGALRLSVWNSGNPVPAGLDLSQQTGLGLRLVQGLVVDQYGGTFTLEPQSGGTLARVLLSEERLREGWSRPVSVLL
jgi:two-component sensor histidine kinase/PAS domain-containing protein